MEYYNSSKSVATGYQNTYVKDKYGNEQLESSVATGWKQMFNTLKITRIYYTDHLECPYCGHKFTRQDMEESEENIAYNSREEQEEAYNNDKD